MKTLKKVVLLVTCVTLPCFAQADDDEIKRIAEAKITLLEAVQSAQEHTKGEAYEAEIEDDSFNPEFEVKVVKEGKKFNVTVDGNNGKVLRVK